MLNLWLDFEAEVTDEQSLLNGRRLLSIDGESQIDHETWAVSLSFERPKSPAGPIEEGDLTLTGQSGTLVGGLASGRIDIAIDEMQGDERDVFELSFRPLAEDGELEDAEGRIEVTGSLSGAAASLRINLRLNGERCLG